MTRECDRQTDEQTDILIANTVLNYVAWTKMKCVVILGTEYGV